MTAQAVPDWLPRKKPAEREEAALSNLPQWPSPMVEEAFYGLAGRFVRLVEPHTEADRHLLLINFLTYAGIMMGRARHLHVGGTSHHSNLFVIGVGPTAGGRKGSAFAPVEQIMSPPTLHGLSSGEGLIWNVRDPIPSKGKRDQSDPGIEDKRLLVKCGEFQGALTVMRREGNPLSSVLRNAHDGSDLELPTKNNPARATAPHIGMIGNITKDELLNVMTGHDASNGLLNRFLWICATRSKQLPEGGKLHKVKQEKEWKKIQEQLHKVTGLGTSHAITLDEEAQETWGYDNKPGGLYRELTKGGQGLLADATARGHVQVLRIALTHSGLDGSDRIRRVHLDAGHAAWRYGYDSARFIFGDKTGDSVADEILAALRRSPGGMNRTEINKTFSGHQKPERIGQGLARLQEAGSARYEIIQTSGRPEERWFAC